MVHCHHGALTSSESSSEAAIGGQLGLVSIFIRVLGTL